MNIDGLRLQNKFENKPYVMILGPVTNIVCILLSNSKNMDDFLGSFYMQVQNTPCGIFLLLNDRR